jgi:hypothetical protein
MHVFWTLRQQGWLGKAAAGLPQSKVLTHRPEPQAPWTAAGVLPLSGGRLPAGSLALRCPMLNRFRVGGAVWFEARLSDFAPAGLAGKSGSRAAAVQGADALTSSRRLLFDSRQVGE